MKRIIVISYLIALHSMLVVAIVNTELIHLIATRFGLHYQSNQTIDPLVEYIGSVHQRIDPNIPTGATIFLGDSITMELVTTAISPNAVNYGVGGLRSDQLIKLMDIYKSIKRADWVVITIGTNDLMQGLDDGIYSRYQTILSKIPSGIKVIMSSVPPLNTANAAVNKKVRSVVESARRACVADSRCRFVNTYDALSNNGYPLSGVLQNDGIHLDVKGYKLWIDSIRKALDKN
jgi:lysophospholipase L1-like esterase